MLDKCPTLAEAADMATKAPRVSIDDLLFAEDWLANGYEADEDDDNGPAAQRVAAWIRAEIKRRQHAAADRAVISQVAAETGRSRDDVRRAYARVKAAS